MANDGVAALKVNGRWKDVELEFPQEREFDATTLRESGGRGFARVHRFGSKTQVFVKDLKQMKGFVLFIELYKGLFNEENVGIVECQNPTPKEMRVAHTPTNIEAPSDSAQPTKHECQIPTA